MCSYLKEEKSPHKLAHGKSPQRETTTKIQPNPRSEKKKTTISTATIGEKVLTLDKRSERKSSRTHVFNRREKRRPTVSTHLMRFEAIYLRLQLLMRSTSVLCFRLQGGRLQLPKFPGESSISFQQGKPLFSFFLYVFRSIFGVWITGLLSIVCRN